MNESVAQRIVNNATKKKTMSGGVKRTKISLTPTIPSSVPSKLLQNAISLLLRILLLLLALVPTSRRPATTSSLPRYRTLPRRRARQKGCSGRNGRIPKSRQREAIPPARVGKSYELILIPSHRCIRRRAFYPSDDTSFLVWNIGGGRLLILSR